MDPVSEKHSTPPEPISMEAAEDEILALSTDIDMIQAQLSDKNRLGPDCQRMSEHEYHQWRHRAVFAVQAKIARRRTLKAWVKRANIETYRIAAGVQRPGNVVELLGALAAALREATAEDRTTRETALLNLAENYIRTKGVPAIFRARQQTEAAS